MDKTVPPAAAIILDFIRKTEVGREDRDSYEVIYGHKQGRLARPLTSMTVDEVIAAQQGWSKAHGSSAAGAYQFMRATLVGLKQELGLRGGQKLDPDLQDRLGYHLLLRRGFQGFMAGTLDRNEFGKRLAQEWSSFPVLRATKGAHRPVKRGQSFYAGDGVNKALVKPETVEAVLDRAKAAGGAVPAPGVPIVIEKPVVVEKPVVADPGELEKNPAMSKTVWQWIITTILVPVLAVFNNPWVQALIVVIITGFAVYAIKRRVDLYRAVKDLRSELE